MLCALWFLCALCEKRRGNVNNAPVDKKVINHIIMRMKKNENSSRMTEEGFNDLLALTYSLIYEDEFRRVKVKTNLLDSFLKRVADGSVDGPEEFIEKGIESTFTPALLFIIKEKLYRFAKRYIKEYKGTAAFLVLDLINRGLPLQGIPFFIAIFARSASRRPLSEDNSVWKLLYQFLPKRLTESTTTTIEKPEFIKKEKDRYEHLDSGLLIPKEKKESNKKASRIIIPGGE